MSFAEILIAFCKDPEFALKISLRWISAITTKTTKALHVSVNYTQLPVMDLIRFIKLSLKVVLLKLLSSYLLKSPFIKHCLLQSLLKLYLKASWLHLQQTF